MLRDRLPTAWSVVAGDDHETYETGGVRVIEFAATAGEGDEARTYFAEAPSGSGAAGGYTFGPVEFSADGGETWHAVPGTTETNTVTGVNTSLTLGAAVGGGGAFYRYRDRLGERLGGLFGRED